MFCAQGLQTARFRVQTAILKQTAKKTDTYLSVNIRYPLKAKKIQPAARLFVVK